MYPESGWRWETFVRRIQRDIHDLRKKGAWCCRTPGWGLLDYGMNESLRRFKLDKRHGTCSGCQLGTGQWEDYIHALCYLVGQRPGSSIVLFATELKRWAGPGCRHFVFKICKKVTGYMKMGGTKIHPLWRHLTYWELGYGYTPYVRSADLAKESRDWLVTAVKLGGPIRQVEYERMLAVEAKRLMEEEWKMPRRVQTVDEWIRSGVWMRGHSGTGGKTTVQVDGKEHRTRRMKGVEAALHDNESIKAMLFMPVQERFEIIQKSEGGKIRPVVKTGNRINRMMDYLSEIWEVGMYGSRISTLFAGARGNEEIDLEMVELARDEAWIKVPLDQGSFDQHQSKGSIKAILDAVWWHISKYLDPGGEAWGIWSTLYESLFVRGARVTIGGKSYSWQNGLPSGWRWTAILDTFLNICSFRVNRRIAEGRLGRAIPVRGFHAQGDDVIFATKSVVDARVLIDTYSKVGYEVHPMKTYISRTRSEFLRRSYERSGITGYTARTCLSIMYRNPILELPVSRAERVYSRLAIWHLCTLRGCDDRRCARAYIMDSGQAGVLASEACDFAVTPNCMGGGGLDTSSGMGVEVRRFGKGEWLTLVSTKHIRDIRPTLGKWEGRLSEIGVVLRGSRQRDLNYVLARSWGMREADLLGKVWVNFVRRERISPLAPGSPDLVPKVSEAWDLEHVPALVRNIYQRQLVEDGRWREGVKASWWNILDEYSRRMSAQLFGDWLVGDVKVPAPMVHQVGMRYGYALKQRAEQWLRHGLGSQNIGWGKLERHLLWIEEKLCTELKSRFSGLTMGV